MSQELLEPLDLRTPLETYASIFPLLNVLRTEIKCPVPLNTSTTPALLSGSGVLDSSSFTRYRELWRWIERLLWRGIILSCKQCSEQETVNSLLWTFLDHYRACSIYWPANFRTNHRSTIAVLHLRALILRARGSAPIHPTARDVGKAPAWLSTARSVAQDYRSVISVSTRFPKAGVRNVNVEEFVDLCVAVWEEGGALGDQSGWVIDVRCN